jgi:cobalt transporter subunit CbtB
MDTLNHSHAVAPANASTTSVSSRIAGAMLALALGVSIISAVGFLQGPSAAVHNAAHDTRHAFAFPCH